MARRTVALESEIWNLRSAISHAPARALPRETPAPGFSPARAALKGGATFKNADRDGYPPKFFRRCPKADFPVL